jgi:hypothetical protein
MSSAVATVTVLRPRAVVTVRASTRRIVSLAAPGYFAEGNKR